VYDTKRQIWSSAVYNLRVFTYQVEGTTRIWDELTNLMDSYTGQTANQLAGQPQGAATLLGGDGLGFVYKLNEIDTDNGAAIPMTLTTQAIAPFGPQVESRLGWVDLLMDRADGKTARVSFFKDYETAAYAVSNVDLTGDGTQTKVRRRVRAGQIGRHHQVELYLADASALGVDLLELHVASVPGGMRLL
jgi:hypothetical protein